MPIRSLPKQKKVNWKMSEAGLVADVASQPLRQHLDDASPGFFAKMQSETKIQEVSPRAFATLKIVEHHQQLVSQLVPFVANLTADRANDNGDAMLRYRVLRQKTGYDRPTWRDSKKVVALQTGVCDDINSVLYQALAETNVRMAHKRRQHHNSWWVPEPMLTIAQAGTSSHTFVEVGDKRDPVQAADVVVGDSWDVLPIVKMHQNHELGPSTWSSFAQTDREPGKYVSLEEFSKIKPYSTTEVLADARRYGIKKNDDAYTMKMFANISVATQPTLQYKNRETGEIFTPTINGHDFEKYARALQAWTDEASWEHVRWSDTLQSTP